jgi:hypothetical protein
MISAFQHSLDIPPSPSDNETSSNPLIYAR